ncbi:MAG: TldD/PmbA family protein [Thermodesulfovibrionia bacterium]|nr:TldD/PmbA family protein [Thermodesulfovibrionia bacterium]
MDLNLAEDIVKKALSKGADSAEAFVSSGKGISVEVKDGEVDALEASLDAAVAVRVIKNGRLGFSFTTDISVADKVIDEAIEGSRWSAEDIYNVIPQMLAPSDVPVFDSAIAGISEAELIRLAISLEESSLSYDKYVKRVRKAGVSSGVYKTAIVNSNGVSISYQSSHISAQIVAFAENESGDSQVGSDYSVKRRAADLQVMPVAVNAAKRALELLGSRRITAMKLPIVLPPDIAVEFLEVLSASFSADAVQKQRSFFGGKSGKTVASSQVNIIDDGLLPWGIGSSLTDDEGVPAQKKVLISEGVLNGFIHNTYTAKKENVASTGNAVRSSSKGLPGVGITNLYIEPEKNGNDKATIISSLSKGILITSVMGVHMANPVSGDFSIGISGLMIEAGQMAYPFKEAVISGNILDMFKMVEQVGSDLEFYGRIGSPSLLIGEMDISA